MQEPRYKTDVSSLLHDMSDVVNEVPFWTQQGIHDIEMDFSRADASVLQQQQDVPITFRGRPLNVTHKQGYYYGNVALVRFGSSLYAAVRKIQFYFTLRTQLQDYPLDEDPGTPLLSLPILTQACFCTLCVTCHIALTVNLKCPTPHLLLELPQRESAREDA